MASIIYKGGGSSLPSQSGHSGKVLGTVNESLLWLPPTNLSGVFTTDSLFTWQSKTANFTAQSGFGYFINTVDNVLIDFPSSPTIGDTFQVVLVANGQVGFNETVNGVTVASLGTDFYQGTNVKEKVFRFYYLNSTYGWFCDQPDHISIFNFGAGDPYFNNVVLFLKGDGANGSTNIVDSSLTPKTVSVYADAQISTAQSKYGGSSIYFDGAGDYLQTADNSDYAFGTGDFTIEFWLYKQRSTQANIIDFRPAGQNGTFPLIYSIGNNIYYYFNSAIRITGTLPGDNQWIHVALSRNNGESRLFINGIQSGITLADTQNYTSSNKPTIGSSANTYQWFLQGYIDSLRITKITGRYTTNFNPETDTFLNT